LIFDGNPKNKLIGIKDTLFHYQQFTHFPHIMRKKLTKCLPKFFIHMQGTIGRV